MIRLVTALVTATGLAFAPAAPEPADPAGARVLSPNTPVVLSEAAPVGGPPSTPPARVDPTDRATSVYAPYDAILRDFVRDGWVDYKGLAAEKGRLDTVLDALTATSPEPLDREERLALWINAYNVFTLVLILDHYPGIGSIKEIPRGDRWKARRWRVGGRDYSLDQIEHEILRKMDEPRIHFAIVCASVSCPDLRSEAYAPGRIDAQLDTAARAFLADTENGLRFGDEPGLLYGTNHVVRVSSIFDWFRGDFEDAAGSVIDFILPLVPEDAARYIREHRDDLDLEYLEYDWSLNGS